MHAADPAGPPAPQAAEPAVAGDEAAQLTELALALILSRQSVPPKRLHAPGPTPEQLQRLLEAAATAPDHHGLRPWRLVRIADTQRARLADLFEQGLLEHEPQADAARRARAREKAFRAPLLLLAVLRLVPADAAVPPVERVLCAGAALMALLLAAHGMGYGAMLTGGRTLHGARLAQAFGLCADEQALCFVSIGSGTPRGRPLRPSPHELLQDWAPRGD